MKQTLKQIIDTPATAAVDPAAVAALDREWPAFIFPTIIALRHPHPELSQEQVARMIQKVALAIPDRRRLRLLLDPAGTGEFDSFYPPADADTAPSTADAISTFLANYGHSDPAEEEMLSRMIFNPVPADYALTLKQDDAPASPATDELSDLIDSFISKHPEQPARPAEAAPAQIEKTPAPAEKAPAPAEHAKAPTPLPPPGQGDLLSQSLAKIFIKQGRYRQAYEIIRSLSLNYPEKSVYFADQLRFLRKLIHIQEKAALSNNKK